MSKNIKLNMSRRIRRTPYTNRVEQHGVSDFTVVNHMLLPKGILSAYRPQGYKYCKIMWSRQVGCGILPTGEKMAAEKKGRKPRGKLPSSSSLNYSFNRLIISLRH